jgi:hypothetical protein
MIIDVFGMTMRKIERLREIDIRMHHKYSTNVLFLQGVYRDWIVIFQYFKILMMGWGN